MKYFAVLLLAAAAWSSPARAQQGPLSVYAYSGGGYAYIGGTYVYFGQDLGLGVSLALNEKTFAVNHTDAVTMNDGEINDVENAYRYNDEFLYDRGFLTGRLYVRMGGSLAYTSTWLYAGVGPGWQRYYYGYDRSGASDTVYVLDSDLSEGHTEVEAGVAMLLDGIYLAAGVSALNFSKAPQLTWGFGVNL